MRKLLQINPVIRENTSTGKIMRGIAELAMRSGWESHIAYSKARDGVPCNPSHLVPVGDKADLMAHAAATRLFDAHGLASKRATMVFIEKIKEIGPDIIHIHNIHGYFLNYPLLCDFLARYGKPVVWTAHDCWLFTGHCYHYSAAGCMKWETECGPCPQKTKFPASYLLDKSRRNFRVKKAALTGMDSLHLVAVSRWMREEIGRSFLAGFPCDVIHNGIDLDVFKPRESARVREAYGIGGKPYALAVASIWLREKGLDDLVRLSGSLGDGMALVVVGQIPGNLKKTLPKRIIHIERTSDALALSELYSGAVALVNPTWQDNFPTVNLEATACGTPVITYRTGGSVETVSPQTGIIVGQGDVEGLTRGIAEVTSKGKESYSGACRKFATERFDKDKCFKEYIDLYESLAAR